MAKVGDLFLFNNVVPPGRGDYLLVVDISQAWDFLYRGSVAPQLVGMNDLWNIVFN